MKEIGEASTNSKVAFYKWKQSGTPRDPDNQEHKNMKQSKKLLWQKQRQARARCRDKKYCDIMESSEYNQKLLYKLVNEQRKSKNSETEILIIDGTEITEDNNIIETWKTHFEGLSTPIDKPYFDQRQNTLITIEYLVIKSLLTDPRNRKLIPEIMAEDIEKAIFKLKNGKAPDHLGLTAEHLKHGRNAVINYITDILNNHSSQLRLIPYLHHTSSVLQ